jgi:hypothetical protein
MWQRALLDADFIIQHPHGAIAARDGLIVYLGSGDDLPRQVRRVKHAMRIDASGCLVLPSSAAPLAVGAPLNVVIVKEGEPGTVRMEIANGKIVRWT